MIDTTELYIKMCDCPEIQGVWHDEKLIGKDNCNRGFGLHYEHGYEGSFYYDGEMIDIVDYEYETAYLKSHIWLPRQDQLQEMVIGNFAEQYQKLERFIASSPVPCPYFGSWEQLWLAFVMKECYNKIWSTEKEEWVSG